MSDFWKKYKDPRWQKKRLEVLERAHFKCEECADASSTLHAHHKIYYRDRDPWDYENRELACLCDSCHEIWHSIKDRINATCIDLDEKGMRAMLATGLAIVLDNGAAACCRIASDIALEAFGRFFGLTAEDVLSIRSEDLFVCIDDIRELQRRRNTAGRRRRKKS